MSYDFFLFQLKDGVSLDDVNRYVASDKYSAYIADIEENGTNAPLVPQQFVNTDLDNDELESLIARAYFQVQVPERHRTETLNQFLASGDNSIPYELKESFRLMFECSANDGILPFSFGFGGLKPAVKTLMRMLEQLSSQRIAVYDPQQNKVADGTNARKVLKKSAIGPIGILFRFAWMMLKGK